MRIPLKAVSVVLGATVLSTLGISASDSIRGVSNSLMGLAIESEQASQCPVGSIPVSVRGETLCVDLFEASPDPSCTHADPKNMIESEENLSSGSCKAVSQEGVLPWRFISLTQAQQACAKAGKRLPTNEEWYRIVLGTPTGSECNIGGSSQAPRVTASNACVSSAGVYDMIGNVWEWVDESVTDGSYRGRPLPASGYVGSVDSDGVALSVDENVPQDLYGKDYFWSSPAGVRGMIRGGFYGGGSDAGTYAINASVDFSFASLGIGFRCVEDASL